MSPERISSTGCSKFALSRENCPRVRVRLRGEVADFDLSGDNALDRGIETLILSVIEKYAYML